MKINHFKLTRGEYTALFDLIEAIADSRIEAYYGSVSDFAAQRQQEAMQKFDMLCVRRYDRD